MQICSGKCGTTPNSFAVQNASGEILFCHKTYYTLSQKETYYTLSIIDNLSALDSIIHPYDVNSWMMKTNRVGA
jgi:hypothetical protein